MKMQETNEPPALATAPSDGQTTSNVDSPPLVPNATAAPYRYSVFTKLEKRYITYLLGFLTLASSLTATIYFPLIPLLAEEYKTSTQAINLTITLYVVFQGITPSFWGPLSDSFGRRPVFIMTFGLYTAASLGLAFAKGSYTALLLLRALQSTGGSAVLSLAYGVVADLVTSAERGSMLGPMLASGNLGPCIGPIIGAAVMATSQPTWCFWALVIFGGISFTLICWTFPETRRTIVGNGSVPALSVWRTWWSVCVHWRHSSIPVQQVDSETARTPLPSGFTELRPGSRNSEKEKLASAENPSMVGDVPTGKGKLIMPNPLKSLRLIFYRDTCISLWLAASPYAVWYLIQTSIPIIYGKGHGGYGFGDIYVGLCYLPGGCGVVCGGFIAGRMMDRNYKHVEKKAGFLSKDHERREHDFPIEQARSRFSLAILSFSMLVVLGFAWSVQYRIHPAVPLIFQFYLGAKCTILLQVYSALVVDIFPEKPGTIAATNNIVRCGMSAAVVAALDPLVGAMGHGWLFTIVALLDGGLCMVGVVVLRCYGKGWRDRRRMNK